MKYLSRLRNVLLVISLADCAVVAQGNVTDDGSCSICTEGEVVTNPDTIVRTNTAGFTLANQTCADIEDLASSGSYSYFQCNLLDAASIGDTCGCGQPSSAQSETQDDGSTGDEGDDNSAATEMFNIFTFLVSGLVAAASTALLLN